MKNDISILLVILFTLVRGNAQGERLAQLPDGAHYIANKAIITNIYDAPAYLTGQAISGIAVTGVPSVDALCLKYGVTTVEPFYPGTVRQPTLKREISRIYIFTIRDGIDPLASLEDFTADPIIELAEPYIVPELCYMPNDPQIGQQWHLYRTRAFDGWDHIRGDSTRSAIIGIVDTGVYWTHPDLAANIWVNALEDLNGNGTMDNGDINNIDDDGNGYIDDVVGWDMGAGDNDPSEQTPTHGTHVAGCASEVTDNNRQGAAIGFSARLMAGKGANELGQLTGVYQAMVYCADNGAHIINCSWGTANYVQAYQNLINGIWADGAVIVAAAGNSNSSDSFYPAAYNNVVAVAATNPSDHKSSFSNYGTWVDVSAPGENIFATWAQSSMDYLSGTSMASPITSGLAGLMKAACPYWTNSNIVDAIITSADTIDHLNPDYVGLLGSGRINCVSWVPPIPVCSYIIGDINGNGETNGIDVAYAVNYLKDGAAPPDSCDCPPITFPFFAAGDVNGNCAFNGIDVGYFINYLKGGTAPATCQGCLPGGLRLRR